MCKMSESGWHIYMGQNMIVNVSQHLKSLILDTFAILCKYSQASKLFACGALAASICFGKVIPST